MKLPRALHFKSRNSPSASGHASQPVRLLSEDTIVDQMNNELQALAEIFPHVSLATIRDLLQTSPPESRCHCIAEALLTRPPNPIATPMTRTTGPNATQAQQHPRNEPAPVPQHELVRSQSYKTAVREALQAEFPRARLSKINCILQEHNFSYTLSRPLVKQLHAKSWTAGVLRYVGFGSLPEQHPLISGWSVPESSSRQLSVRPGVDQELAREVQRELIGPVQRRQLEEQQLEDRRLAEQLDEQGSGSVDATYDCQCCLASSAFESVTVCSTQHHFICFECVRQTVSEAVHGQGWASSVDYEKGTLRCIGMSTGETCPGYIPRELIESALRHNKSGCDLLQSFDQRLARKSVCATNADLLKCPSCAYAEVAPSNSMSHQSHQSHQSRPLLAWAIGCLLLGVTYYAFPFSQDVIEFIAMIVVIPSLSSYLVDTAKRERLRLKTQQRLRQPPQPSRTASGVNATASNKGRKFVCRSPTCGAVSCLNCLRPWNDPHTCFADSSQSLRQYVEAAVSAAIKRTCPVCQLAFIKDYGCNKMICTCGYAMCYLCRAGVPKDGYDHFCNHFRPQVGLMLPF